MKKAAAGIFAAGAGSRFQAAGVRLPKPLIQVGGRPLIGWVLEGCRAAGFDSVTILLSSKSAGARAYGDASFSDLHPRWLVKDTASTLESFCVVSSALRARSFLLSTVDAVCAPSELRRFAGRASRRSCDMVLGVTRHRVDETSLRLSVDRRGFASEIIKGGRGPLATAGLYWFGDAVRREARRALARGVPSLSSFLGELPRMGFSVGTVEMSEVFDVDRPEDVSAAERLLAGSA
jgi:NDP-sugar pyrophosphorylase family protein